LASLLILPVVDSEQGVAEAKTKKPRFAFVDSIGACLAAEYKLQIKKMLVMVYSSTSS
jgi:hypothetical protein